jgi:hypothetical protein
VPALAHHAERGSFQGTTKGKPLRQLVAGTVSLKLGRVPHERVEVAPAHRRQSHPRNDEGIREGSAKLHGAPE